MDQDEFKQKFNTALRSSSKKGLAKLLQKIGINIYFDYQKAKLIFEGDQLDNLIPEEYEKYLTTVIKKIPELTWRKLLERDQEILKTNIIRTDVKKKLSGKGSDAIIHTVEIPFIPIKYREYSSNQISWSSLLLEHEARNPKGGYRTRGAISRRRSRDAHSQNDE